MTDHIEALQRIQQLLGCAYGLTVSLHEDDPPCPKKAVQIVVLHDGDGQHEVRLCAEHLAVIEMHTKPREEP